MSPLPKRLKDLCSPALFYFVISMLGFVASAWQNMGRRNIYILGGMTRRVPSTALVFLVKIIYVLFWTWILNLICKDGHTGISWFLVLIPFILLFSVVILLMISPVQEGLEKKPMSKQVNDLSAQALGGMPL
jgi:fatty acid desaturase